MADRFRELERPQAGRLKDVVLMATVTGFEGLRHTRRAELKQFSELFVPLFAASSDEARRQAAAALSRCDHVPPPVALQIGSSPISIAAIFLTRAPNIDEPTLLHIIRNQSPAHATAIARRDDLSPRVIDALVAQRQTLNAAPAPSRFTRPIAPARLSKTIPAVPPSASQYPSPTRARTELPAVTNAPAPAEPTRQTTPSTFAPRTAAPALSHQPARTRPTDEALPRIARENAARAAPAPAGPSMTDTARVAREDRLRDEILRLARRHPQAQAAATPAPLSVSPFHEALLVRFARSLEVSLFTASLSAALGSGLELAERIVLDVSGLRLATALSALDVSKDDTLMILGSLYPHLSDPFGVSTRADALLTSLPSEICRRRVETWLRLEANTLATRHEGYLAPDRASDRRMTATRPALDARTQLEQLQQATRRR